MGKNSVKPRYLCFAYYDEKSCFFTLPFVCINKDIAIRDFKTALNDPRTNVSKYPADFILYEIGTYNEFSGQIVGYEFNVIVTRGNDLIDFMKQEALSGATPSEVI